MLHQEHLGIKLPLSIKVNRMIFPGCIPVSQIQYTVYNLRLHGRIKFAHPNEARANENGYE
ncbi:hypothetical protein D3C78_600910 [compost metagenome]